MGEASDALTALAAAALVAGADIDCVSVGSRRHWRGQRHAGLRRYLLPDDRVDRVLPGTIVARVPKDGWELELRHVRLSVELML
jgi:hypothetical protein